MSHPPLPSTILAIIINWVQRMGKFLDAARRYSKLFGEVGAKASTGGEWYSGPENIHSTNWETYSFMRTRHVPVLGTLWGHEATDIGLAYAPVSEAHGHHHTQFNVLPCCTAAQTSSVLTVDSHAPLRVAFECALAVWASGSACTHHPPTAPVSL